jgi:fatty-acyl-CoA synthase
MICRMAELKEPNKDKTVSHEMKRRFETIVSEETIRSIESIPLSERYDHSSTWDLLEYAAGKFGDRPAIQYLPSVNEEATVINYSELLARCTQTANLLYSLGIRPDKAVSLLLPNIPEMHYALWGSEAEGVVNPINTLLEPEVIAQIITESNGRVLLVPGPELDAALWAKAQQVVQLAGDLEAVLVIGDNTGSGKPLPAAIHGCKVLDFHDELRTQPAHRRLSGRVIRPDDIASYFHTGGTTGTPKLAQHTHANEVFMAWLTGGMLDLSEESVAICGLPLFHVNGVFVTGLGVFAFGGSVVIVTAGGYRNKEVLRNFWQIVSRFQASMFSGVPTFFAALNSVPVDDADISSLKYALCGAAPMPVKLFESFQDKTGIRIQEGYGLTEGACISTVNPAGGEQRIGSIGIRIPYQEAMTAVLDSDGAIIRACETNEIGNLLIRGPNVFPGYKREDSKHADLSKDGWFDTGDLARQDEEAYFWLTGRAKDIIIRGGHNIDPGVIENALSRHPAVELVAAIGQPDAYAGELPAVYVSLKANAETTAEELKQFAKEHVPERAAVPVYAEILEKMPVTAVGKIFKPDLRRLAVSRVFKTALAESGISAEINVIKDERWGIKAMVTSPGMEQEISAVLGNFSVHFEIQQPPAL